MAIGLSTALVLAPVASGARATERRYSLRRTGTSLSALPRAADLPASRLRRKNHLSVGLLIIDKVGFEPMSRHEASLFFRLVNHPHQRGGILITSHKGIKDWPKILAADEVLATATLDRLPHNSHVLNIKGRSYRLRDLERAVIQQG